MFSSPVHALNLALERVRSLRIRYRDIVWGILFLNTSLGDG